MNNRIKELRKSLGLTGADFGDKIGITKASVSKLEGGVTNPSEQTIRSICREFGVNEVWLRTGEGEPFLATDAETELGELVRTRLLNRPVDFRRELITALLRFDPDGPEWQVLETIVRTAASALPASDPAPRREGSPDPSALSAEAATPERTD